MTDEKKTSSPFSSGITAGYMILLAHLLLIIILATAVVFIQTLAEHIEIILAIGLLLILGSTYIFFRMLKQNGRQIIKTLNNPTFAGQNIEVSLLGGLASLSLKRPETNPPQNLLDYQTTKIKALPLKLDDSKITRHELLRIADLHERGLIDKQEFLSLKKEIMASLIDAPHQPFQ